MNKELYLLNFLMIFILLMILFTLMINIMNLHPIMIISILLIYSMLICFNLSLWKSNYIYSIMLFLIMISGLLIIFLYFSSLISNEQNNFKLNKFMFLSLTLNMIFFFLINNLNNLMDKFTFMEINLITKLNKMNFQNILNLYEYPFNNLTIISMSYLLISLFTIIKICSIKSTSMRKIN